MSKKTVKLKANYIKKDPNGTAYIDAKGFQSLKEEESVFCYNKEEPDSSLLEFFCSICNKNMQGLKICENHWKNSKHKKQLHGHESKIKHFKNLRTINKHEESLLTDILLKDANENLLNDDDLLERRNICMDIEETIKASGLFDISCHLFGSSITQIGYHNADVNIDINYDIEKISKLLPEITDVPLFLFHIYSTIKKSTKFCDVADLFHLSTPRFSFTHVESGLHCIVCPYYKPGFRTSLLIKDYIASDERAKILCFAFRNWAKICGVDDPSGGSLSPYCFTLMVIHYLQQVKPPVLPVINLQKPLHVPILLRNKNEKNSVNIDQINSWKSKNTTSIGKLWVGLFKYYLLDFFFKTHVVNITQHSPMVKQIRGLNGRRMSIEDPFFIKDNAANTLSASEVMEFFYSCLEKSYRYFSGCDAIEKGDKKIEPNPDPVKKAERKKRKEERKKLREERRIERKQNKKQMRKEKKELKKLSANSENSNDAIDKNIESLDKLTKDIVADLVGDEDIRRRPEEDSTDSIDEDSDESDEDTGEEEDETNDEIDEYICGDNDMLNEIENQSSDIEIEEEYIEQNGELVRVGAEDRNNQGTSPAEQQSAVVDDDSVLVNDETVRQSIQKKTNNSSTEESSVRPSSRDYDSQYDGDADDSQAEDDNKQVYVEGGIMEGLSSNDSDPNNLCDKAIKDNHQEATIEISIQNLSKDDKNLPEINKLSINNTEKEVKRGKKSTSDSNSENTETPKPSKTGSKQKETKCLDFSFLRKFLAPTRQVPLFCKSCNNEGHRNTDCDSMNICKPPSLPPLTKDFLDMVDRLCEKIINDNELTIYEKEQRNKILQDMEKHLRKNFEASCRLSLFGSSVNNFGFRGSDLDICLRFGTADPPPGLDHAQMVVKVARALDKHDSFHKVMYIKSAKVPIVKFVIKNSELEGDISLYNCLALNNSRMLKAYSVIDKRVRIIGYCAKVFAKVCEMGDASRGSLSSYAYTLLTLYYLQRCEPPVIPVLQDLYDHSKEKPTSMVEGWNTWYYSDIDNLAAVWPGYGKNKQSIGELWLGFLRFYVEKFDFARNVVAMKQLKTLSKFQKGWTHATMCIEDPFNLHHNLAAGISRNMFKYILGCFQNARLHFHTTHPHFRKNSATDFLLQYFFSRNHLTENKNVPRDRLCHRCGRIGHTVANCAEKIVADRERRRLDSEKTYSSDNGDSDVNQKSKGKNAMDHIQCYGCNKYGHRVANCPSRGKSPGNKSRNRERNDSDRAGFVRDRKDSDRAGGFVRDRKDSDRAGGIARDRKDSDRAGGITRNRKDSDRAGGITRDRKDSDRAGVIARDRKDSDRAGGIVRDRKDSDKTGGYVKSIHSAEIPEDHIQTASEMHPMENIELAFTKIGVVKNNSESTRKPRTPKKNLRAKVGDLEKDYENSFTINDANSLFSLPSHQKLLNETNSLFSLPTQQKSLRDQIEGHQFSPEVSLAELNAMQASVDGVSFLRTTIDSPINNSHTQSQRRKISPQKGARRLYKNNDYDNGQNFHDYTNNQADFSNSPSAKKNGLANGWPKSVPPGFQAIPDETKGNGNWPPNPSGFQFIGQTAPLFPNQNNQNNHSVYQHFPNSKRSNSDILTSQNKNGVMNQMQTSPMGYHFAQPGNALSIPNSNQGLFQASPTVGASLLGSPSHDPGKFQFDDFAKVFQTANSPPDSHNQIPIPSNEQNVTMMYDEEFHPPLMNNTSGFSTSPSKQGKRKGRKGNNYP